MKSQKALTVQDAWELYNMAVLASSKKKDQISERGRWENHIKPVVGKIHLKKLTTLDYLKVRRNAENNQLSPQTVYHCLSLLRRVLNKIVEWLNYSISIPSFRGVMPKFDNKRLRFLTKDEAKKILHLLSSEEFSQNWHQIALFALSTGLRKSEIFNLNMAHVDFENKLISVMDTKSCRNRTLPLNDSSLAVLHQKKRQ